MIIEPQKADTAWSQPFRCFMTAFLIRKYIQSIE